MARASLLSKEKVVRLSELKNNPGLLRGLVRIMAGERKLSTKGFFLDKKAFEDLYESIEYSSSRFWEEIEKSRSSGVVSSKEIERRLDV